jgi:hypothetical protein
VVVAALDPMVLARTVAATVARTAAAAELTAVQLALHREVARAVLVATTGLALGVGPQAQTGQVAVVAVALDRRRRAETVAKRTFGLIQPAVFTTGRAQAAVVLAARQISATLVVGADMAAAVAAQLPLRQARLLERRGLLPSPILLLYRQAASSYFLIRRHDHPHTE